VASPLAIVQVSPYPLEDEHDVNAFVRALSRELAARDHAVVIAAPSRSPEVVRESRRRIRAGDALPAFGSGEVRVLGVGELLPMASTRGGVAPAPPVDVARTLEELLTETAFDVCHVHEPFAASAASVALRHSHALNVGTFHAPTERVLSTQVARRFVERFFGRLDVRTASFRATQDLMQRYFPASYRVVAPGAAGGAVDPSPGGRVRIAFPGGEERAALRLFLRALRRLPADLDWEATVHAPGGATPTLRGELRQRVRIVSEGERAATADVVVAASLGTIPAPGNLLRGLGAGAVPLAARLPAYEEVLAEGELGLLFEPGDVETLAAQLERLIVDPELRERLRAAGGASAAARSWSRVADDYGAIYSTLVGRRHDGEARNGQAVRARLRSQPVVDVDLHMHTDHSHDCATPVETLLATARDRGLSAIAVTDHNEISGAHAAAALAEEYGVKVIVGEEIKTDGQGEVIGLFISEKIARGMTLRETIGEIHRQGGLAYVPHPFDRMHSVPDYEHLLEVVDDVDALEVFNPRIAIPAFNEEAVRFAAKYRIPAGAGSDSHVAQGLGSVRIRMRDFDGPEEFLESLRDADIIGRPSSLYYAQVQALKFLQTKVRRPAGARKA
jgi:glycosyltransferase involved in cell wall biosynthesis